MKKINQKKKITINKTRKRNKDNTKRPPLEPRTRFITGMNWFPRENNDEPIIIFTDEVKEEATNVIKDSIQKINDEKVRFEKEYYIIKDANDMTTEKDKIKKLRNDTTKIRKEIKDDENEKLNILKAKVIASNSNDGTQIDNKTTKHVTTNNVTRNNVTRKIKNLDDKTKDNVTKNNVTKNNVTKKNKKKIKLMRVGRSTLNR